MPTLYVEDQSIERGVFSERASLASEYENCRFVECDFADADLSKIVFINCTFTQCNLSNANIEDCVFNDVSFDSCKLLGLKFTECSARVLALAFSGCQLNLASFFKLKLRNMRFQNCRLHDVDFAEADLTNSVFDNCDLRSATFEHTVLHNVDMRSSVNYSIDPEKNQVKKAKFSLSGVVGLLDKYDIVIE